MAQPGTLSSNDLPGIVTDQPEIFESAPAPDTELNANDLDLITEHNDEDIALIEVPIKQAFSYFAERENEIAKFFVQRCGEYKINGSGNVDEETDIEKYHRLVAEVNELLHKFQAHQASSSEETKLSAIGALNHAALINNLDILSSQLKALEYAAEDGGLNPSQAGFNDIRSQLTKLNLNDDGDDVDETLEQGDKLGNVIGGDKNQETAKLIRMSAFERRLNLLESVLGHSESKAQSLLKTTKCDNLIGVADTLSNWLSLFKPDNIQKIKRELDYLTQRLETINEQVNSDPNSSLDPKFKASLDQLCDLLVSSDKSRALVPTIIHRLNAMEELQKKAAHVTRILNRLEQVQDDIVGRLQSNKDDLTALHKNIPEIIKDIERYSRSVDEKITSLREKD